MTICGARTEEVHLDVGGKPRAALLRTPERLTPRPALLINLAVDRRTSLDEPPYCIVPDVFLAAGYRVASFDLPNHGQLVNEYGEGLIGMAAAIADGVDVFDDVRRTGTALIDRCLEQGLAREDAIVVDGTSRGGLAALHVMAADGRILACAVHAPVTHLPRLDEFAHLAGDEIVARSNAASLVDRLADRTVFIAIGQTDPRVGAEHCLAFHAALCAVSRTQPPELFTAPGASHGEGFPYELGYHAAAGFLLRHCAEHLKRSRLARECAKLDAAAEKSLAEEGLSQDVAQWPEY